MKKRKKAKKTTVRVSARRLAHLEVQVAELKGRLRASRRFVKEYQTKIAVLESQARCPKGHLVSGTECTLDCWIVNITPWPKTPAPGIVHEWTVDHSIGWFWRVPYRWWLSLRKWWAQ